jgi:hypothetical protein
MVPYGYARARPAYFAEGIPVAETVGILVLDHHDGLAFAGNPALRSGVML